MGNLCDIKSVDDVIRCARLLNEFGSIVYFDKDPQLADFVVLDPRWLTNGRPSMIVALCIYVFFLMLTLLCS